MASSVVFVYGSLKRGYALHHLLRSAEYLGPASTQPLYRLFDLGSYPGLVEWPEGLEIQGELYSVTPDVLQRLDHAEGVAEGLYARRPVLLQSATGQLQAATGQPSAEAWFWLGSVNGLRDCGSSWPAS
jgi:gamma-glutamylaminecyclotransferase